MIALVKRPNHSQLFSALSPILAFGLTLMAGAIVFAISGQNPATALYNLFYRTLE